MLHLFATIYGNFKGYGPKPSSDRCFHLRREMREGRERRRKRKGVEGFIARYRREYYTRAFIAIIVVHCAEPHFFRPSGDVQYLSMKRSPDEDHGGDR